MPDSARSDISPPLSEFDGPFDAGRPEPCRGREKRTPNLGTVGGIDGDDRWVDTHVHFWDHAVPGLAWSWLAGLDAPRYTSPELASEAGRAAAAALVHVACAHPVEDPAVETEWLQRVGDEHGQPNAIVATCALAAPGAVAVLRRHARSARFRGVRDLGLDAPSDVAMDAVAALGCSVELRRPHERFGELVALAGRWPGVTVTLSHACFPAGRSLADLDAWSVGLGSLAARPNVVCKISAVAGPAAEGWSPAAMRPWVLSCVERFGADRCVLGSNWPVDRRVGAYADLVDAYREVLAELTTHERAAVLHGTAERVYGIEV